MIVIGITGSIATGKTFLASCFEKLGAAVFNADEQVHDLLALDEEVKEKVKLTFPKCIKDNKIDRNLLGNEVFSDTKKLTKLEKIIHPIIEEKLSSFLSSSLKNGRKISVLDVPLLFEKGLDRYCDYTIVTFAHVDLQNKRALEREGMTEEKLSLVKSRQLHAEEKASKADFVVDTNNDKEHCLEQVKKIITTISA